MAVLQVTIHHEKRTARFTGDTYNSRDKIKELGARYNGGDKSWELREFRLTVEELRLRFPNIVIEEIGIAVSAGATENAPSALPAARIDLPDGLSVSQFLDRARAALRKEFPATFCIFGVLSDVKPAAGGRIFMELKAGGESDDRVKCVIWDNAEAKCAGLLKAGFRLESELEVMFEVSVNVAKRGGQISLSIERIVAEYTLAKLAALREQTNERLRKEGLFEKNKQLALPFLPKRLGVLTSAGGTVINDFLASLETAKFGFELYWMNASVQGAEAKQSILKALGTLSKMDLDAILIFRGGGSQAELAIFNDYDIARAVCLSPLPVVSAIGHEQDQSSVQDVSWKALGVPKEVGWFFANFVIGFRERFLKSVSFVSTLGGRSTEQAEKALELHSRSILKFLTQLVYTREEGAKRLELSLPVLAQTAFRGTMRRFVDLSAPLSALGLSAVQLRSSKLQHAGQRVHQQAVQLHERATHRLKHIGQLERELHRVVEQREARVDSYKEVFESLGPETQLKRGFAMVRAGGKIVTRGMQLSKGDEIEVQFHDEAKKADIK